MLSVSWTLIDEVLAQAGPLDGKIVIDTTNQFGREGWEDLGERTAAQVNAARMPGARYTKAFNTLTSGFQAQAAGRTGSRPRGDVPVRRRRGGQARRRRAHRGRRLHAGRHGRRGRRGADGGAAARRARSTARSSTSRRRARLRREAARRGMTPTLYEWAGGAEALDRLTQCLLPPRPRRPDPGARVRRDVARASPPRRAVAGRGVRRPARLHRGARRLPAHAVQAPRPRPDRGAARPLGRAHHARRRRRRACRPTPSSARRCWPTSNGARGSRWPTPSPAPRRRPRRPCPHWGWGEAPPVSAVTSDRRCRSARSRWSATSPSTSSPPSSCCAPPTSRPTRSASCWPWPTTRRARCGRS